MPSPAQHVSSNPSCGRNFRPNVQKKEKCEYHGQWPELIRFPGITASFSSEASAKENRKSCGSQQCERCQRKYQLTNVRRRTRIQSREGDRSHHPDQINKC